MKDDRESCSTGSSMSGIYKNILNNKSPTPICMFYFSHPFGISTPSSANNAGNIKSTQPAKKASKYTTKTYLVTEIQKNHSDSSQDETELKKHPYTDRELIPWPKNFLLPPLIQLIEKKHGKKLPDIDAILKQVRKQAWNTPKSRHSHNFWSRGSSVSSDDFSSLASPDSANDKTKPKRGKLRRQSKNIMERTTLGSSGSNGSGRGKSQTLLKRRYSVPEIIMRKYSLAQQKSYEESTGIHSTTSPMSEAITKSRNGQSSINNSNQPTQPAQPATVSNTRTSSPIKYFIPLSPQPTMSSSNGFGGSGGFLNTEISMRKQTLLRRMWSREFQHSKYSGSWSPPLRRSTHQQHNRLQKFNTLPETISSSCEKCKELGVLARNFDEEFGEAKEDKSQQTDFDLEGSAGKVKKHCYTSPSSGASTIVHSADVDAAKFDIEQSSSNSINNSSTIDSNGNNIIICMTALQEQRIQPSLHDVDEVLRVEIDGNNNSNCSDMMGERLLRKQFSTQIDERETASDINYKRLREDNLNETEIDEYISQMLIQNLNTVIKTVNENLQANGERNLVKIDYHAAGDVEGGEDGEENSYYNNKFGNQHEISIQMRNAKNGDTANNRNSNSNSNEPTNPTYIAVERDSCGNADGKSQRPVKHIAELDHPFYGYYGNSNHSSLTEACDQQLEVTAIINSGTSYPEVSHPESIFIPRFIGPKTESMEVNPSSSSAQEDDEFDGVEDSDGDEDNISDVDSLDDIVTIRAKKLSDLAHQQHKKAQALFRQTHLKGQAFFVPIVDTEQPIDEHIVVADTMPEKLKERLVLRQRRRDMKKKIEIKEKQWRMQKFIERKMGEVKLVNNYIEDLANTGGAFKIIGVPSKNLGPIETNVYRRESGTAGGWQPKPRLPPSVPVSVVIEASPGKPGKSKKLRNEIGMLESYKIDGRGNMQIQNPGKGEKEKVAPKPPKIKRMVHTTTVSETTKKLTKTKSKTPSEVASRKSNSSSKRNVSNIPTSSASSVEAVDARRRQVMKDVQQMSVYKNDLTPDPDSGPSRKMWKTEIQEGDKHIEILEIVECVDGTSSSSHQQMAPEHNSFTHLFPPSTSTSTSATQNHKYYHVSSSSSHPKIVNKTFSVRTTGFDGHDNFPSRIPIPVYRYMRSKHSPFMQYEPRDSSPSNNNYSSSTDAEESITSAGSSSHKQSSKVDRMIANLLMEALKSPDDLGIDFVKSPKTRKSKRRSHSPAGADSSSTGYYTGDSSSRRSASNSAGKYQHRFEVIPEEKSSFSVDSSNDDFLEDEEEENEKINNINSDWKSRKDSQNNDIKTKSVTPKQEKDTDEVEDEKSKTQSTTAVSKSNNNISNQKLSPTKVNNKTPTKNNLKPPSTTKSSSRTSPAKSSKASKTSSSGGDSTSAVTSPEKKITSESKSFTTFSENSDQVNASEKDKEKENENDCAKNVEEDSSQAKSEDAIHSPHLEHKNLIHQFMSNKSSSSSNNNHFHYHLYQYQTHNCCFNLFDQSQTSSTVNTAASNENFSSFHTQSIGNTCQTAEFSQSRNTQNFDDEKSKTATSSKFNENFSRLTSSGSEFPSMIFNNQNKVNFDPSINDETPTPSYDENTSKSQTAEKVIEIELSNEDYRKPEDARDDCSCTKKYFPYKVNEKNVWQVYETSDCKYIQSRYEIDEIFQPPPATSSDGNKSSEYNPLLHSRSNISNHIICHSINHDSNHSETAQETSKSESVNNNSTPFKLNSTSDSLYTPTFNIKSEAVESCKCIDEETEDNASKMNDDGDDDASVAQFVPSPSNDSFQVNKQSGKLLNRPKATNNISRDQVKPIEKEIQNEITRHGVKTSSMKALKSIRLPSPVPKRQSSPPQNFDNSETDEEFSSIESQCGSVKENKKSPKVKSNHNSPKEKTSRRQQSSLMRPEKQNVVIPNIHQGWSVTVAGTHPDLAPDVEMKLSFPKVKGMVSTPDSNIDSSQGKNEKPEVFYYRNNQLLPAPDQREMPTQLQYERYDHKPYYNHRRSLSLARIDSGMSGMIKPKSYNLPNLHVPRPTARNAFKQVECTTISASKTIIPSRSRRSLSLDVGNRRLSLDSRSQASPFSPNDMLSVVGSEIKKTLKPRVKTMSEKDLTKRHLNCFTRSNGTFN